MLGAVQQSLQSNTLSKKDIDVARECRLFRSHSRFGCQARNEYSSLDSHPFAVSTSPQHFQGMKTPNTPPPRPQYYPHLTVRETEALSDLLEVGEVQ